ncbi:hypothetical protein EBB07_29210 [Paenibacillaceae bacterium]|nr:hypothetical protein EBB07_29210 [Paenibacillaceae bacterium]
MNFGKELKRIIKEDKGLSLTWVAAQLGENEKTFTGWLNLNRISGESLIRVANVCDIDLNELKLKVMKHGEGDTSMSDHLKWNEEKKKQVEQAKFLVVCPICKSSNSEVTAELNKYLDGYQDGSININVECKDCGHKGFVISD